ncbi:MAG: 30S ribosomal protein S2 [Candidatus Woesebacteria bacterium]|nr:30S ribosomal protein S2 [Candidatus Woesebacteria bacterium]
MTTKVSAEELLERGAHFGHQSKRWNPKMGEYLYGEEGGVHVFDLIKTKALLEEALEFLKVSSKEKKSILFVGCKKQAQEKTREVAEATGSSYFTERWLGGTLTNFDQIKKSIKKLIDMKEKMTNGEYASFTKKERLLIDREIARLERYFGGISKLEKVPDILVVIDTHKEISAIKEANSKGVKIVGIVDSNADPEDINYPIPMNDDASKAIEYVLDLMKEAILDGKTKH